MENLMSKMTHVIINSKLVLNTQERAKVIVIPPVKRSMKRKASHDSNWMKWNIANPIGGGCRL